MLHFIIIIIKIMNNYLLCLHFWNILMNTKYIIQKKTKYYSRISIYNKIL